MWHSGNGRAMETRRTVLAATAGALAGCLGAPARRSTLDPLADRGLDARASAQFQGGVRNRGYVDRTIPESVRVDWSLPVNRGEHTAAKSSPMPTPDGDVVICGDTGTLRRLAPSGTVRWEAAIEPTGRGIHGTPAIAIGSSPVYRDGVCYVAVEYVAPNSGSVVAVHAGTGEQLWGDARPTDHPHSTVGIDPDRERLVVGSNDGTLYAWTFPGLERAWTFDTGGPIKAPIPIADGIAIVGSWDDHIYGVDVGDGSERWSVETGGAVMTAPAVHPDGTVFVGSQDDVVYAVDLATGDVEWTADTGGWLVGGLTATPAHVLVGSYTDRLHAFDAATGRRVWSVRGTGYPTGAPLVTDDAVYYTERADGDRPGRCYRLVAE